MKSWHWMKHGPDCWPTFKCEVACMTDDVLINKAASIERRIACAREKYQTNPDTFATNFTRQDAAF